MKIEDIGINKMPLPPVREPRSPGKVWSPVDEICAERQRQNNKWGEQNYPSVHGLAGMFPNSLAYNIPDEQVAKSRVNARATHGHLTWADILLEEFAEAVDAPNDILRRAELVQVAAVALAWIECIDRRRAADLAADASLRPAGDPRCTPAQNEEGDYYVLVHPWAVYVKEGEFFKSQGGLTAKWGQAWRRVRATSIEDARQKGEELRSAGRFFS